MNLPKHHKPIMRIATLPLSIIASYSILAAAQFCNTGQILCCNQLLQSTDPQAILLGEVIGIPLPGVPGSIGVSCSPLSVLGVGDTCSGQIVCCQSYFNGLIAYGCTPLNLNL